MNRFFSSSELLRIIKWSDKKENALELAEKYERIPHVRRNGSHAEKRSCNLKLEIVKKSVLNTRGNQIIIVRA